MIREGTQVEWNWANGKANGKVKQVFNADVTRTINGSEVKREANTATPAYLIEQDDGQEVLKSSTEVRPKDQN